MKKLTPTQESALKVLKATFDIDEPVGTTFDPEAGRQISRATMAALFNAGYLKDAKVHQSSELKRNRFGHGYNGTKTVQYVSYRWA